MFAPALAANPYAIGGWVLIEPEVLEIIGRFRQDAEDKPEAGGILLGFRRGPHLHIVEATEPTHHDRRWRTGFERSAEPHQQIALRYWRDSGGRTDYLGEWHTHPQATPSPSGIDVAAWRRIHGRHPNRSFVFLIAGNAQHWWFGVGQGEDLHQLAIIS